MGLLLDEKDVEALFRGIRISLHIVDEELQFVKEIQGRHRLAQWTAKEVVERQSRRQLYNGEQAGAFVVASLPNFDQVRWGLATAMRRTGAQKLSRGELAVSADEMRQFFGMLRFSIAAYQATTVASNSDSSNTSSPRVPGSSTSNRAVGGMSQQHRIVRKAVTAAFTTDAPLREGSNAMGFAADKLENGAWCGVYPITIDTPIGGGTAEQHTDNALVFEIRATCTWDGDTAKQSGERHAGHVIGDSQEARLAELATRISTETARRSRRERSRQEALLAAALDRQALEPVGNSARQRVVQTVVATRPAVGISTRVVVLPPSFGADAALVEVSVRCDVRTLGPTLLLNAVRLQSPDWHIQTLAPQQQSQPSPLVPGTCWQTAFRISMLAKPIAAAAMGGLQLLNGGGAPGASELLACVSITAASGDSGNERLLEIRHRVSMPDSTTYQKPDNPAHSLSDADATSMWSNPTGSLPSVVSARSSEAHSSTTRATLESSRPQKGRVVSAAGMGHAKTVSLDNAMQARIRKLSLIGSLSMAPLPDTAATLPPRKSEQRAVQGAIGGRPPSMLQSDPVAESGSMPVLPLADAKHASMGIHSQRGPPLTPRMRAATVNAAAHAHRQRSSISTVRSPSTAVYAATAEPSSYEVERASLRRRSSVAHAPNPEATRAALPDPPPGAIDISFEAPPKATLGDEVVVRVHLTNNTSSCYSRLCIVDVAAVYDNLDSADLPVSVTTTACGLLSAEHSTLIPPLLPGASVAAALRYTAAAPHFQSAGTLRLVDLDSIAAEDTLAVIEAPFVVYVCF
ncbi:hypothetical protein H4R20_004014 [Coemansia guatemalensis]|uniref:Uncharacterized protein n=1 Tax=Coemansia guatemalensis TaxID=2761395 RepID=A0A9W8HU54_9FUNG|nr:hypothetical protein H4R20_004014 [Coemansia guatemalensis]